MAKLLRVREEWRADSEREAEGVINDACQNGGVLLKKEVAVKQKKAKGEVIDEYFHVITTVEYDTPWGETL